MIEVIINNVSMKLITDSSLFSSTKLDSGTAAMLSCLELSLTDKVLDLGCGYGVVGIYAAKLISDKNVTMSDISETAVDTATENARQNGVPDITVIRSDGFKDIPDAGYTVILSNPPYHADFAVAKHFIEKGFNRLAVGGRLYMVTKRFEWYRNKLISIFGGVTIREIDGYHVFIAEKRNTNYAQGKKKR